MGSLDIKVREPEYEPITSGVKLIVISMSSPVNNVMGKLEFRLKLLLKILPDSSMRSPSPRLLTFKIYLATAILSTVFGAGFSLRQLYLQSLPADLVPSCAPDIGYLFDSLPFIEVVMMAIQGDGNCAEVMWSFLGVSIPGWTLVAFFGIAIWLLRSLWLANEIHSLKFYR